MAKIPLRTYIRNIEGLIERGEVENAIAHAKNILQTHPKHIETYRLLGKAYLENQRYAEAADILQRVLSVFPDDFVSHIGMSIILEDENNLDAAIWHMERAYEVQPFNPAVQEELRRLYGRRDGSEPPKIRLTRGALVRMYARGELYQQAIAEIRSALAEDPQRLDLQVLLARMYYLNGQRVEATEICSSLLSKLPYCFEANSILAEVLPGTSRAGDAEVFQQRINAMDPYRAFISPSAPAAEQVPDQAVTVDEFYESDSETTTVAVRETPEWAVTAGVQWEDQEPAEELPDWLNTLKPETPSVEASPTISDAADEPPAVSAFQDPFIGENNIQVYDISQPQGQDASVIPDWMKSAGWDVSDGTAQEQPSPLEFEDEEGEPAEAAPGEIPEWLQTMAPSAAIEEDQLQEDERLGWLASILPGEGGEQNAAAEAETESPQSALPTEQDADWLAGLGSAEYGSAEYGSAEYGSAEYGEAKEDSGEEAAPAHPSDDVPAWLQSMGSGRTTEDASDEAEPAGELPDWLASMGSEQDLVEPESRLPDISGTESAFLQDTTSETNIDWLTELESPTSDATATERPTSQLSESATPALETPAETYASDTPADENLTVSKASAPDISDADAAMAWLESLAARQGADEETLITPPDQRTETPPGWVQELGTEALSEEDLTQSVEQEPEAPAMVTPWEADEPITSDDQPGDGVEATPSSEFAAEAELPDWLKSMDGDETTTFGVLEPSTEMPTQSEPDAGEQTDPLADVTPGTPAAEAAPDLSDMDAAMAWLEGLAAKQGADEETLTTPPELRTDTPPDWLTETIAAQAEEPEDADNTPTLQIDATAEEKLAGEVEGVEELPAWLMAEGEGQEENTGTLDPQAGLDVVMPASVEDSSSLAAETPDLNDMDAAMAWLESLAAKQGADEETLTTPPDQRTDTPPDWLTDMVDEQTAASEQVHTESAEEITQPVSVEPVEEEEFPAAEQAETTAESPTDFDAAFAWLEALAAKQGADEATLLNAAEDRAETAPEWVQQAQEEAAQIDQAVGEPTGGQTVDWFDQDQEEEDTLREEITLPEHPTQPVQAMVTPVLPDDLPIDAPVSAYETEPAIDAEYQEQPANVSAPEWPQEVESQTSEWVPEFVDTAESLTTEEPIPPVSQPGESENLPEWLKLDSQQAETHPAASTDSSLDDWLRGLENEPQSAESSETYQPGTEAPVYDTASQQSFSEDWTPEAEETVAAGEFHIEITSLTEAQTALMRGQLDSALACYNRFIQDGEHLDEVIHDLRDSLYRYPVDINIWQMLGDAYARNNQLQEAIDAYTKAEELLR